MNLLHVCSIPFIGEQKQRNVKRIVSVKRNDKPSGTFEDTFRKHLKNSEK